jgi:FkbM family methyltransferase
MEENTPTGFVIYGAMRTGSNYLVSLLNQFEGVVCHGEAFNPGFVGLREDYYAKLEMTREDPAKRDADIGKFYNAILERENPAILCGFKMFPGHNPDILRRTLSDPSLVKIILKRDVLTSFISLCQAETSGVWMIQDGNKQTRSQSQARSDVKIAFDGPRFLRYRQRVHDFYREVEESLRNTGQNYLHLWYKDLTAPSTVRSLEQLLNRNAPAKLNSRKLLVKQNLSAPHERVSNVREMIDFLDLQQYSSGVVETARLSLRPKNESGAKINGVRINSDSPALSPAMRRRILSGKYEVHEAKCVSALVEPGEVVLELGGGIGYISSLIGITNRATKIVVVEANPDTVPLIQETHHLNNVEATVLNAVAMPRVKHDTNVPFYIREDFWASSLSPEPWGYSREVSVPCLDFGDLLADRKPSMLVCDIEGGEANLLLGTTSMRSVRKIILELHQRIVGLSGIRDIFLHLSKQGFAYDPSLSEGAVVVFRRV